MDDLRERRERQKEMVEAIVKKRDMYRTLLAQATPLPQESPQVKEDRQRGASYFSLYNVK